MSPENGRPEKKNGADVRCRKKRRLGRRATVAIAVALIAVVLVVGLWGMWGGNASYLGVKEVTSNQGKYLDRYVEVRGTVKLQSHNTTNRTFTLLEGSSGILVNYTGAPPSNFEEGKDVVVKGTLRSDGGLVLVAKEILVGCASKY
ncbi:MAG: cytochrome c maturation protein CcmE [Euryarchaeota archaeon]|nr:cytochrome c maturation protein CcmE [Euryarchaeota archaeon]